MELSAIIHEYNLPLTHSERTLVDQLSAGTSAASVDRYRERMKELAAARDVLKQLPDRQTSERQRNMEKAAMLKERLKMLRQMIPFMSRSALKSLNAEMRQIAAQLASLGGENVGETGGVMSAPAATGAATPESANAVETASQAVQTSEAARKNDGTRQEQHASSDSAVPVDEVKNGESGAEDRQLKETVEELKNLYKTVLAALKRKQQSGQASHLRAYAALPDSASSVAITV